MMRTIFALIILSLLASGAIAQESSPAKQDASASHRRISAAPEPDKKLWFEKVIDDILVGPTEAQPANEKR
jgi:hypothetical protein